MKKKTTSSGRTTSKCPKKVRTAEKVVAGKKTSRVKSKTKNALPGTTTARLKRTIRRIKSSVNQLEKVVGK
jgi:hypothetical protein